MVVLLDNILSHKVVDILDQWLARVCQISQALHQLLRASDFLQVHDDQLELNDRFTALNEL